MCIQKWPRQCPFGPLYTYLPLVPSVEQIFIEIVYEFDLSCATLNYSVEADVIESVSANRGGRRSRKHPKISTNDISFARLWGTDGGSRP